MQIKSILLRNFKGYGTQLVKIDFSDINLLFGKNSSGKSTLFQALSFFYTLISHASVKHIDDKKLTLSNISREFLLDIDADITNLFNRDAEEFEIGVLLHENFDNTDPFGRTNDFDSFYGEPLASPFFTIIKNGKKLEATLSDIYFKDGCGFSLVLKKGYPKLMLSKVKLFLRDEVFFNIDDTGNVKFNMEHCLFDKQTHNNINEYYLTDYKQKKQKIIDKNISLMIEEYGELPEDYREHPQYYFSEFLDNNVEILMSEIQNIIKEENNTFNANTINNDLLSVLLNEWTNLFKSFQSSKNESLSFENSEQNKLVYLQDTSNYFFSDVMYSMLETLRRVIYIGPLRSIPNDINTWSLNNLKNKTWYDASLSWVSLLESSDKEIKELNDILATDLNTSYQFVKKKYVCAENDDEVAKLYFFDTYLKKELNLSDVGTGISQILPIYIAAICNKDCIILSEQPELHMHPSAQLPLMDLAIDYSQKNKNQFLFETHSEHLLLRMQKRIREYYATHKKDNETYEEFLERFRVNYFQKSKNNTTTISEILMTKTGELIQESIPQGFFEESLDELF